ncbi:MAG: DEAD/DEAH box helicase [Synechococcaceae cyanobacterium RL_1_2]|nr:DEAD/DEAH box helicase [Synechococcaceae cyanobacterium RL_1_2]
MTTTFQSLGLSDDLVTYLENLGFTEPTEIQIKAIPELLQGKDVVGKSQTGTGKTAAFSLPIIQQIDPDNKSVQALILSPTRELAQQVTEAIKDFSNHSRRLFVLTVCGGQSMERQIRSLQRGVHIVVGTPGRVIDLLDRKKLDLSKIQWAVLDEADEMLSMGFIDDVKKILSQAPKEKQTTCFSATMPPAIRELVNDFLIDPTTINIQQTETTPDRIEQRIYHVPRGWTKTKALLPIIEMESPEAAIIFVRTKRTASEVTSYLQEAGQNVDEYHGDLSQSQRERLVQRFRQGKVNMIVATDIAARGLDVEQMTHVINYDLPDSPETYIHRIGRTGRAGKSGIALALIKPSDRRLLSQIERRLKQRIVLHKIPNRTQVEGQRLEKLKGELKEALAGERMASFLHLVNELHEEYDPQAIAAAALQMIYDQNCPDWMKQDWDVPESGFNKPIIKGKNSSNGPRSKNYSRRDKNDGYSKKSASYNRSSR